MRGYVCCNAKWIRMDPVDGDRWRIPQSRPCAERTIITSRELQHWSNSQHRPAVQLAAFCHCTSKERSAWETTQACNQKERRNENKILTSLASLQLKERKESNKQTSFRRRNLKNRSRRNLKNRRQSNQQCDELRRSRIRFDFLSLTTRTRYRRRCRVCSINRKL